MPSINDPGSKFMHLMTSKEKVEIDSEIASLTRLLSQTADDHPALSRLLTCLGAFHMRRFDDYQDLSDLEKAIEYTSIALSLTPDNHPGISTLLSMQAILHDKRFQRLSEPDDVNKAIEYAHTSKTLIPEGDPGMPGCLMRLGVSYSSRFERLGNSIDLEDAIEHLSCALALASEKDPDLPVILDGLGVAQRRRFERTNKLNDLDDAITYMSRGISLTPDGSPILPASLCNLGMSYNTRFRRLGELADLENAIEYGSRALALTPNDDPGRPDVAMNLGLSHYDRFMRQGNQSDLEKTIEYQSHAVALTPDGHPQLPFRLANLADSYSRRFECSDGPSDIENAIEYQTRALALTPSGHPGLSTMYANLAAFKKYKFAHQRDPGDLEAAIKYGALAISQTPEDHPDFADWQFNYALTQVICYHHRGDGSCLWLADDFFRRASRSLYAPPHKRLIYAQGWAKHASDLDPIEAYQIAIEVLPQVVWLGSTTDKRYEDLSKMGTLAVDAAYFAMSLSEFGLAVEWLEHARCVVWNQHLMLRSPVDQLMLVSPDLATRLQTVATQLHSAGSESQQARAASGLMNTEQVAQEHRRLAKAYDDMLVHIRQLEGFENFLRPIKINGLVCAARMGPVVLINCYRDRCDALIILPGDVNVHHVGLPGFSARKAQQARKELDGSLRAKGVRERGFKSYQQADKVVNMAGVLATLWHNVVKPILEFLECMSNNPNPDPLHITWCPTGALSFLPLHAAGDYDQPRSRVFDYVISSYTPTLAALLTNTPSSLSIDCKVLAIGQAATPGHSPLPGTETEIARIRAHSEKSDKYSELLNHQATVPAVLDAMEQHDWVHLACHAHQNVVDPTRSGFFLHEGTLDLATINRRSFKGKGLAFLSACQTATGDEKLADEAVHLASGMLMAGYTSVIGTMWSVHDEDAPLIADKVYTELMKDRKLGNGEAGRALHNAVAILRETVGDQRFERWVPYIHLGS